LAHPLADLLGIAPHQAHAGLITPQQRRQGMAALQANQGLDPVAQHILHDGPQHPVHGGAAELLQPGHHAKRLQAMEEILQHRPCVQPVDAIDHVLTVQPSRHTCLITAGDLPTPSCGQVFCDLVSGVWHRPPPVPERFSALEESGA